MNWQRTPLTERLGIRYPIVQAPMAGGATTPQLVAAASNAGALGSLGAGYMDPEQIRTAIHQIRELTDKPFAVNLFVPQPIDEDGERIARAEALLAPIRQELGLPPPNRPERYSRPDFNEQLGVILEESVAAFSFTFGVPRPEQLEAIKAWGIATIGTATHLLEAIVLEESGVDMVVAQGMEAGGHRGTFIGEPERGLVGTLALLPVVRDHVRIPVLAAGGIMDGRGIAAVLALGAAGAQLGTAFLASPESGVHPQYKALLCQGTEITTVLTRAFSGRLARGLKNRLIDELRPYEHELPGYPIQNTLTGDVRRAAAEQDRAEFMAMWAGQGCTQCRDKPAGELLAEWVGQTERVIKTLSGALL